jgi:hypothetical protein
MAFVQKLILDTKSVQKTYDSLSSIFQEMDALQGTLTQHLVDAGVAEKIDSDHIKITDLKSDVVMPTPFKESGDSWKESYWVYMISNP